jgi:glucosamine 6-phosphate synthetase-like amidotransferase/phosphosugar isomerase protein
MARQLLIELQPRGLDASGIAVINDPEHERSVIFKKPLRPSRLIVRPRFQDALDLIGPQTNFILLHARASTVGTTDQNFDNHPIITPPVVGIHNGTLRNHDEVFKKFELAREGEVDSEVIFRLYGDLLERGIEPEEAMKAVAGQLEGAFTGAAVDLRHPHRMLMFKFQRPLHVLTFKHYDMVIAISEVRHYDRAKAKVGIKAMDKCSWLQDGAGFWLDVNEPGHIVKNIHRFKFPIGHNVEAGRKHYTQYMSGGYA